MTQLALFTRSPAYLVSSISKIQALGVVGITGTHTIDAADIDIDVIRRVRTTSRPSR
jgi:hypothetical protein